MEITVSLRRSTIGRLRVLGKRITCACATPAELHALAGCSRAKSIMKGMRSRMVSPVRLEDDGGIRMHATSGCPSDLYAQSVVGQSVFRLGLPWQMVADIRTRLCGCAAVDKLKGEAFVPSVGAVG